MLTTQRLIELMREHVVSGADSSTPRRPNLKEMECWSKTRLILRCYDKFVVLLLVVLVVVVIVVFYTKHFLLLLAYGTHTRTEYTQYSVYQLLFRMCSLRYSC